MKHQWIEERLGQGKAGEIKQRSWLQTESKNAYCKKMLQYLPFDLLFLLKINNATTISIDVLHSTTERTMVLLRQTSLKIRSSSSIKTNTLNSSSKKRKTKLTFAVDVICIPVGHFFAGWTEEQTQSTVSNANCDLTMHVARSLATVWEKPNP